MIPNKESLIFFEEAAKNQIQLWNDSCDYGIIMNRTEPGFKDEARENLLALMKTYKYTMTKVDHARYPYDADFKNCSTTELFIPFEKDEGYYQGVKLMVMFESYTHNRLFGGRYTEVMTIDISRSHQKESPFRPIKEKSTADKWAENARDAKRFN